MPQELAPQGGVPRSGRGKQLTALQQAALIRICQAQRRDHDLNDHTKSFWKSLSAKLKEETGRVYSWQSCRRRMLAWETDRLANDPLAGRRLASDTFPTYQLAGSPLPAQSPDEEETGHAPITTGSRRNERLPATCQPAKLPHLANDSSSGDNLLTDRPENDQLHQRHPSTKSKGPFSNGRMHPAAESRSHESSISRKRDSDNDTDDEMLPEAPIPPLRRALHTIRETEKGFRRAEVIAAFQSSMIAFEAQLQSFTSTCFDEEDDRQRVTEAFQSFREEVNRAIEQHNPQGDLTRER